MKYQKLLSEIKSALLPQITEVINIKREMAKRYPEVKRDAFSMDFSDLEPIPFGDGKFIPVSTQKSVKVACHLEELGYSKSFISRYTGRPTDDLERVLKVDADQSLGKVEVAIRKKIGDPDGVAGFEVESVKVVACEVFITGIWKVTMKNGDVKMLSIKSIVAGGHNVQALHVRVVYGFK